MIKPDIVINDLSFLNNFPGLNKKRAIIWDWNGTLLNDIDICISSMNIVLDKRNISPLTKEKYMNIFTFPVREYYKKAGLDLENEGFEKPALEFIDLYYSNLYKAGLFPLVKKILSIFKERGYYQAILSAMEHDGLVSSLKHNGIVEYFDQISGINNHYAHSKVEIGYELLNKMKFSFDQVLLIGDSLHDKEVAEELKIEYLLIANGHQSKERLLESAPYVLNDLDELLSLLK